MNQEKNALPSIEELYQEITGIPLRFSRDIVNRRIGTPELQQRHRELLNYYGIPTASGEETQEKPQNPFE